MTLFSSFSYLFSRSIIIVYDFKEARIIIFFRSASFLPENFILICFCPDIALISLATFSIPDIPDFPDFQV